jgi:hypothetical protein
MPAEQLPINAYTTAEGLAHNHINRIRQDVRGFLWFCTDGGLTRFDGHDFVSYTTRDGIPHPWVNDFLELDPLGNQKRLTPLTIPSQPAIHNRS